MAKTFVAILDPVHSLLREVTRQTPLRPCLRAEGGASLEYQVAPDELPEAYYALAVFHKLEGVSSETARLGQWRLQASDRAGLLARANFFDAVSLDARCCRDLRLKPRKQGPGMLAAEWLVSGTGTLRARNDDMAERMHHYLWSQHGRLHTSHEVVYARIRALHWNSLLLLRRIQKEAFDSTNVIYGDALGEVEQLWERRADTAFLELVVQNLRRLRDQGEIAAFLHPPLNLESVMKLHWRAQALWKSPPTTVRSLMRRVEYLLEHTTLDCAPKTVFGWREPPPQPEPRVPEGGIHCWRPDRSGYDGWLRSEWS
jgi:hypothetical protein